MTAQEEPGTRQGGTTYQEVLGTKGPGIPGTMDQGPGPGTKNREEPRTRGYQGSRDQGQTRYQGRGPEARYPVPETRDQGPRTRNQGSVQGGMNQVQLRPVTRDRSMGPKVARGQGQVKDQGTGQNKDGPGTRVPRTRDPVPESPPSPSSYRTGHNFCAPSTHRKPKNMFFRCFTHRLLDSPGPINYLIL